MGYKVKYRKIHKNKIYTRKELAEVLGITPSAISHYIKKGLTPINPGERPLLIEGNVAKVYFKKLGIERKISMQPNEIYCTKCKAARLYKKGTIVVKKTNKQIGRGDNRKVDIVGKCSVCGTIVYRFSSLKTYKQFLQYYPQNIEKSNDATKI